MKSAYQQPSFTFTTNVATYKCDYMDWIEGEEKWIIEIEHTGGRIKGRYELPIEWSRYLVFQFLSSLEINEIGHD